MTRTAVQLQGEILAKVTAMTEAFNAKTAEAKAAVEALQAEAPKMHREMWDAIYEAHPEAKGTPWMLNMDNKAIGIIVLEPKEEDEDGGIGALLAKLMGGKDDCDCPDCTERRAKTRGEKAGDEKVEG